MKENKKTLLHKIIVAVQIIFIISLACVLYLGLELDPNSTKFALHDKPAYEFSLPQLRDRNKQISLTELKGKPLVLNFWASWCDNCKSEAEHLEAFWQHHKAEVNVLGIAVQDLQEAALGLATQLGKSYPLALDSDGKMGVQFGVTGVPETFFIDAEGKIKDRIVGPVSLAVLEQKLAQITK